MGNTITLQPRTCAITNTAAGSSVADRKYTPSLTTTLTNWSAITYAEGEYNGGTTTYTCYIDSIIDDLATKYA